MVTAEGPERRRPTQAVAETLPSHPSLRYSIRPAIDLRTALLVVPEWGGVALAYLGHALGWFGPVFTVLLAILSLNLAFTIWHEAVHGSISRDRRLNDWIGRLGAAPVFVLFDRFVLHHWLHHRHTNDPEKDPDFWQVDGPLWTLAFRYLRGDRRARALCREASPTGEVASRADRIQILLAFAVLGMLVWISPWSALLAIVIPRLALVYIHSFYVNYIPHVARPAGRVRSARLISTGPVMSWFMMRHNYHALHHAYPSIPWYRYASSCRELDDELTERGVARTTLPEAASLLGWTQKDAG